VIGAVTVAMAVVFNELQGFNLLDIMFRLFSAFGPAIMLPLIAGLLARRVNARGALAGLTAGAVTGVTLVLANIFLSNVRRGHTANAPGILVAGGWNSAATVRTSQRRSSGWARSRSAGGREEKRGREFFANLAKPFPSGKGGPAQARWRSSRSSGDGSPAWRSPPSPFRPVPLSRANAFRIDLIIAGALMAAGADAAREEGKPADQSSGSNNR
jgi:hypothetical protein